MPSMNKVKPVNPQSARPRTLRAVLVFGALLMVVPGTSAAQVLQIGASTPVVVPMEYSPTVGTGFTQVLRFNLDEHVGFSLTSGVIFYHEARDQTDFEVPVLLGGRYTFRDPDRQLRPYTTLQAGYAYANDSTDHGNWLSALSSVGLLIRTTQTLDLDFEVSVRLPNLRSVSDITPQMMFGVGVLYALL